MSSTPPAADSQFRALTLRRVIMRCRAAAAVRGRSCEQSLRTPPRGEFSRRALTLGACHKHPALTLFADSVMAAETVARARIGKAALGMWEPVGSPCAANQ